MFVLVTIKFCVNFITLPTGEVLLVYILFIMYKFILSTHRDFIDASIHRSLAWELSHDISSGLLLGYKKQSIIITILLINYCGRINFREVIHVPQGYNYDSGSR